MRGLRSRLPGAWPVRKLHFAGGRYRNRAAQAGRASGVNLIGLAFGESGIGEHLRAAAAALRETGVPFSVCDYGKTLHRQADTTLRELVDPGCPHNTNLFCLNNDGVLDLWTSRRGLFRRRYNVGYGFWELRDYPPSWLYAMNVLDEIWAPSRHVQEAISRKASVPVVHMPMAVDFPLPRRASRGDFDVPEDAFVFLCSFDFSSRIQRKNPMAVVAAFRQAFPPERREVMLILKSKYVAAIEQQVREVEQVTELVREDPRVRLVTATFTKERTLDLIDCCDVYVSLHRAEGFGLGLAEAMRMGKATIATAYSGNMDFMTPENSCLVGYTLVEARRGESYNFEQSSVWADADVEQAARHMAKLAADPDLARRLGAAAQRDVAERHSPRTIGERYRERLRLLGLLE
jgi:glycosyltransferase involved in cell wall biosynthesis